MSDKVKIDFSEIKRARMAMIMGLKPGDNDSWPIDTIDELISGETEHGFEWLINKIDKMYGSK